MRRTKEHFHPPLVGGDGGTAPISTQGRVERVGRTEFAALAQPAAQLAGATLPSRETHRVFHAFPIAEMASDGARDP